MVQLEQLDDEDREFVRAVVQAHRDHTESAVARFVLDDWDVQIELFKKVMPVDYARVLDVMKQAECDGLDEQQTLDRVMEAARG